MALAGLLMAWAMEITPVAAPNYFVDEQRVDPYRFWRTSIIFERWTRASR
jgi:hypothetical protein